jgi:hypothetical protein
MARKTILLCDRCGSEVREGRGAVLRVTFKSARQDSKRADLCDACAEELPGTAVSRRGRPQRRG